MPPTVQDKLQRDRDREKRKERGERKSEPVCRVKYNNTLPDIPFDPKFITYPFDANRFIQYKPTSLEHSYKHELLTEHDLGVTIDLINPQTYEVDPSAVLDSADEKLLEDESNSKLDATRSRHHNKRASWLRRTEYISTEYNRFTPSSSQTERKVGYSLKKMLRDEDIYKDRESQLRAIEKTFEDANKEVKKHYAKPGVHPVEVLPVFPDFQLWPLPCAQVIFDTDPAPKNCSSAEAVEKMSQAMIRGMVDEQGEQFVAYFLPTEETLGKRRSVDEPSTSADEVKQDEVYDFMLCREYNWNVKNKTSKGYEENYFFVMREDGVYYNELETRVRLSKRRKAPDSNTALSRLLVQHRDLTDQERLAQDNRRSMLEPPQEEEAVEEAPQSDAESSAGGSQHSAGTSRSGSPAASPGPADSSRESSPAPSSPPASPTGDVEQDIFGSESSSEESD